MTCLRRRLAWCNRTGLKYDVSKEQYSPYPRALSDEKSIAHKASKSTWTEKLKSQYSSCQTEVFCNKLPPGWIYKVCIIDAMFLINTKPLRNTRTVEEYAKFLFNRFVLEHYKAGASEVQLIFDKPRRHALIQNSLNKVVVIQVNSLQSMCVSLSHLVPIYQGAGQTILIVETVKEH